MAAAARTYKPHEIAQTLGSLDRMAATCANGWYAATLRDAAAIVRQLAGEAAEVNTVLALVRRWFADADGASLLPEEIDRRACAALVATRGYQTLARREPEAKTKGKTS